MRVHNLKFESAKKQYESKDKDGSLWKNVKVAKSKFQNARLQGCLFSQQLIKTYTIRGKIEK